MRRLVSLLMLPIVELYVLIVVGAELGALTAIALVFLSAAIGFFALRLQGVPLLNRALMQVVKRQLPDRELSQGVMLVIGGVLLVLPGFVTDGVGLLYLLPFTRDFMAAITARCFASHFNSGDGSMPHHSEPCGEFRRHTIEGEYKRDE